MILSFPSKPQKFPKNNRETNSILLLNLYLLLKIPPTSQSPVGNPELPDLGGKC